MKYLLTLFAACTLSMPAALAQDTETSPSKKLHGTFYATWGYQRDFYTNSTVHFKDHVSDNYDFTYYHAKAHDRLDGHDFFNTPITVPQYVLHAGYFFNNKGDWGVEVGWDHLKYIIYDDQNLHLQGQMRGTYIDQDTLIQYNVVHLEHTNGNNYLMASLLKRFTFFESVNTFHKLSFIAKAGTGILVPKSQSVIMGDENDGPFRPSGFVIGLGGSLRYDIGRYFFLEAATQVAYVNYMSIKLYDHGRAKQQFGSWQLIIAGGFNIPLTKK